MHGKLNKFLTLIPILTLFLHILLTSGHVLGAIYYCIGGRIRKMNWPVFGLLFFPLSVVKLPMISPFTINFIERSTSFAIIFGVVHSGCCQIFYIWNHRLLGDPFWKISCWFLEQFPIRTISIGFEIPFEIALFDKLVTSYNWLGRWPYSRFIVFPFVAALTINFLHGLVDWRLNCHSRSHQK